ncbi:hypothetical protein PSPO01_14617 [Paraphaeosphaeria sporulosa]
MSLHPSVRRSRVRRFPGRYVHRVARLSQVTPRSSPDREDGRHPQVPAGTSTPREDENQNALSKLENASPPNMAPNVGAYAIPEPPAPTLERGEDTHASSTPQRAPAAPAQSAPLGRTKTVSRSYICHGAVEVSEDDDGLMYIPTIPTEFLRMGLGLDLPIIHRGPPFCPGPEEGDFPGDTRPSTPDHMVQDTTHIAQPEEATDQDDGFVIIGTQGNGTEDVHDP